MTHPCLVRGVHRDTPPAVDRDRAREPEPSLAAVTASASTEGWLARTEVRSDPIAEARAAYRRAARNCRELLGREPGDAEPKRLPRGCDRFAVARVKAVVAQATAEGRPLILREISRRSNTILGHTRAIARHLGVELLSHQPPTRRTPRRDIAGQIPDAIVAIRAQGKCVNPTSVSNHLHADKNTVKRAMEELGIASDPNGKRLFVRANRDYSQAIPVAIAAIRADGLRVTYSLITKYAKGSFYAIRETMAEMGITPDPPLTSDQQRDNYYRRKAERELALARTGKAG